jgi:hypothetical protein
MRFKMAVPSAVLKPMKICPAISLSGVRRPFNEDDIASKDDAIDSKSISGHAQVDTVMPLTVMGVGVVELTARIKVTDVRLEARGSILFKKIHFFL